MEIKYGKEINSLAGRVFNDSQELIEEFRKLKYEMQKELVELSTIYNNVYVTKDEMPIEISECLDFLTWVYYINSADYLPQYYDIVTFKRPYLARPIDEWAAELFTVEADDDEDDWNFEYEHYSKRLVEWLANGGDGLPHRGPSEGHFRLDLNTWVTSTFEFTPTDNNQITPLVHQIEPMIQRHLRSKASAWEKEEKLSMKQRTADGSTNMFSRHARVERGLLHQKAQLMRFFRGEQGYFWIFNRDDVTTDDDFHIFDLLTEDLLQEMVAVDPMAAMFSEQAMQFVLDRDDDGLLNKPMAREHKCCFTQIMVPAPVFRFVEGSLRVAAMNVDKWQSQKRRTPGTPMWIKSIPPCDRLILFRQWFTGLVEIDGYNTFVDRLAPTKQLARIGAHRLIELSKVEGYVLGETKHLTTALLEVLLQLHDLSEEELHLVSEFMDIRVVYATRFNKGTTTDKTARLDRDLKPIFIGNCTGEVVHYVRKPNGEDFVVPGLKRGFCEYPWIHSKVVDHDVSSASYKVGNFVADNRTLSLDHIAIDHVTELATDFLEDAENISYHPLSYNAKAIKALLSTSRRLENLRATVLQIISQVPHSSEKVVLTGENYETVMSVVVPEDWKPRLIKAISKINDKGRATTPKPQIDYFKSLLDAEWYFTIDKQGERKFGHTNTGIRNEYLRSMNMSLYVCGLVKGGLVKKKRFPALRLDHLRRPE